jgi:hypothetical protein
MLARSDLNIRFRVISVTERCTSDARCEEVIGLPYLSYYQLSSHV